MRRSTLLLPLESGVEVEEHAHDRDTGRSASSAEARFSDSKPRLVHLLKALFDLQPGLHAFEVGIATRRPFLSNLGVHLPSTSRAMRGRSAPGWFDAAAIHAASHLRYAAPKFDRRALKPIQIAIVGVIEDARVERLAIQQLPGLRRLWLGHHVVGPEHGQAFVVLLLRLARALLDPTYVDAHSWVDKGRRLFEEAASTGSQSLIDEPTLRSIASRLGHDIGQMRLQFNHRDYVVEPTYRDDNAHLWHDEQEVRAQTILTADGLPPPPIEESVPTSPDDDERLEGAEAMDKHVYAEWDRRIGGFRAAWCTVEEAQAPAADPTDLLHRARHQRELVKRLEAILQSCRGRERTVLRAQAHGEELDLDAAVRSQIEHRLHTSASDKVYLRQSPTRMDLAALLLIDTSVSTAMSKAGAGSILDVAKCAALLTATALTDAGQACAVDAFCSNGRHHVRYERAIDFGHPVDPAATARLAGFSSRWSTRMGAALRHATQRLLSQPQRMRILLVVTDGEPHDIDIHDRLYLIDDARRAVLDARTVGVAVFCVNLDPESDALVRTIYGSGNYRVLDRIEALPRVLPSLVQQLTRL